MVGCYCIPQLSTGPKGKVSQMANVNETETTTTTTTTTLFFRRMHPGGGPLGRCSYGIPGVPGIVVFDVGMFLGGICPATIVLPLAMAAPAPRKTVATVTSAVVAAANTTVAVETGTAIATPPAVAEVVAEGAAVVVAAASKTEAKPAKDKGRLVRGHKAQVA